MSLAPPCDVKDRLDEVEAELRARSLVTRRCSFFAPDCLGVSRPADDTVVSKRFVFLYARAGAWELRITPHGGPHRIHSIAVEDADALVTFVLAALEEL